MLPGFTSDGVGTFAGAAGVPGGCAPARPAAANKARRQTHVRRIIDALPGRKQPRGIMKRVHANDAKNLMVGSTVAGACSGGMLLESLARDVTAVPPRAAQTPAVLASGPRV